MFDLEYFHGMMKDKRGLSLIEAAAVLCILSLLAVGVLSTSAVSGKWTAKARESTLASAYAASIVDVLRSRSLQLQEQLQSGDPWVIRDEDDTDSIFSFTLSDEAISIEAPDGLTSIITISSFDDSMYYDGISQAGIAEIGTGDNAEQVIFYNNLIHIKVDIQEDKGISEYSISTIISVR